MRNLKDTHRYFFQYDKTIYIKKLQLGYYPLSYEVRYLL